MTRVVATEPGLAHEDDLPLRGDERITRSRSEKKYLVPYGALQPLAAELGRHLSAHRFVGRDANRLPDPHHYVTTVYFDTPSLRHFRAAREARESGDDDVKVRAKAYYDLHPSLAEVATDPDEIVHCPTVIWFEVKRRSGDHSSKDRFRLLPGDVPAFFERGEIASSSASLAGPDSQESRARAAALAYCRTLGEPLRSVCIVNYRRLSFQDPEGALRVTLDLGLSYYRPRPDVWTSPHALERSSLGPAVVREARAVLEVKTLGEAPAWLTDLLTTLDLRALPFSKFVAAAEAVHGRS